MKIYGVGKNIAWRLHNFDINTVEDVLKFTPDELQNKTHMDLSRCRDILIEAKNVFDGVENELFSARDVLKRNG